MKKIMFVVLPALLLAAFGCAGKPSETEKSVTVLGKDGTPRPEWVRSGKQTEDTHYEVGYGKLSNFATSKKKAETDARNQIAFWLQTDVNTVLKTYTQDAGIADDREVIEYMEEVSMQTAKTSLSGAQIEDVWEDAEGGVYVLMSYDVNKAAENLDSQMKAYQRNESAAFAEFKAQEAFRALEAKQAEAAASER
ncbi:MAG: LPP20 family lipoprotein [Bacteroides sp.]|nr:LPP20 family lipoprotein [Prevotella sp.]MCM1408871.1 LPP20 family lipoprotein [Treponema brennaborense]MCM1470769.1 LPP20 family lipoprotein [Bacteroides sp.]